MHVDCNVPSGGEGFGWLITVAQPARFIGESNAPAILDIRTDEDFAANLRCLLGAMCRDWRNAVA